jgi:hypothetical protein
VIRRAFALVLAASSGLAVLAPGVQAQPFQEYLWKRGMSLAEIRKVDAGEAVAHPVSSEIVGPNGTAEMVVLGAVRVDAPREALVEAVRSGRALRKAGVSSLGLIGAHPQAADFAALSLPAGDLAELRSCTPGSCLLKLSRPGINAMRGGIDWRSADSAERTNQLMREQLLAKMSAYVREGTSGLPALDDKPIPVLPDKGQRELFEAFAELRASFPEMHAYMLEFPKRALDGPENVFYWSVNDFGLKPTVTLTHAAVYAPHGRSDAVVVWKQIWASHFFNGGLSATHYRSEPNGNYLVHIERLRVDGLGGFFGGSKRGRMRGAMAQWVEQFLATTQQTLRRADR